MCINTIRPHTVKYGANVVLVIAYLVPASVGATLKQASCHNWRFKIIGAPCPILGVVLLRLSHPFHGQYLDSGNWY